VRKGEGEGMGRTYRHDCDLERREVVVFVEGRWKLEMVGSSSGAGSVKCGCLDCEASDFKTLNSRLPHPSFFLPSFQDSGAM
jgi:hypothetical protein